MSQTKLRNLPVVKGRKSVSQGCIQRLGVGEDCKRKGDFEDGKIGHTDTCDFGGMIGQGHSVLDNKTFAVGSNTHPLRRMNDLVAQIGFRTSSGGQNESTPPIVPEPPGQYSLVALARPLSKFLAVFKFQRAAARFVNSQIK